MLEPIQNVYRGTSVDLYGSEQEINRDLGCHHRDFVPTEMRKAEKSHPATVREMWLGGPPPATFGADILWCDRRGSSIILLARR